MYLDLALFLSADRGLHWNKWEQRIRVRRKELLEAKRWKRGWKNTLYSFCTIKMRRKKKRWHEKSWGCVSWVKFIGTTMEGSDNGISATKADPTGKLLQQAWDGTGRAWSRWLESYCRAVGSKEQLPHCLQPHLPFRYKCAPTMKREKKDMEKCIYHLRLCSHLTSFLSCQRLFYIIILWSKPCFQKSPERFLKRHRRRLFLQLRASFQVEHFLTFLKKKRLVGNRHTLPVNIKSRRFCSTPH